MGLPEPLLQFLGRALGYLVGLAVGFLAEPVKDLLQVLDVPSGLLEVVPDGASQVLVRGPLAHRLQTEDERVLGVVDLGEFVQEQLLRVGDGHVSRTFPWLMPDVTCLPDAAAG